jgi:hypothetical protein
MHRRVGAALFAAMVILFLIANRGAYQGYFHGDDLDNLSWTRHLTATDFAQGFVSPQFFTNNFRPTGHLVYALMGRAAGLDFRWYVAAIHLLHFANVWLVWLLARRLGLGPWAAAAGGLFFAFHMGVFDALWKPMYVFDVLCASLCLLSLLAYARRGWVVSLVLFWLAYKAKEVAVMLPAVLALYEYWFGEKRWKRLAPFFAVSLWFGLQVLMTPEAGTDYALGFSPGDLWKTVTFYSSQLLLPYAGLAVVALPLVLRDRRLHFGLAALGLLLTPMLLLPGRLSGAYLYLPLAGAAVALAALAGRAKTPKTVALVALFFLAWIPWNYAHLRANRRVALTVAQENRSYVSTLLKEKEVLWRTRDFVYDGVPQGLQSWGIRGALRYIGPRQDIEACPVEDPCARKAFDGGSFAVLGWDPGRRELSLLAPQPGAHDSAYIQIRGQRHHPPWQLEEGWRAWEYSFRWIRPYARARLWRPPGARTFELVAHIGPDQIRVLGRTTVEVYLEGRLLGRQEFTEARIQALRWPAPPGQPGPVRVEFRVTPEFRPAPQETPLGIPIAAFGFTEEPGP